MNRHVYVVSLLAFGALMLIVGAVMLGCNIESRAYLNETLCSVSFVKYETCHAYNPGGAPFDCATIHLNATVCGITAVTSVLVQGNKDKIDKEYPIGSGKVKCWTDSEDCSVDTETNESKMWTALLVIIAALINIAFAICFCCLAPNDNKNAYSSLKNNEDDML